MLKVFLTVDTEIWPFWDGWPKTPLPSSHNDFTREMAFYIYGDTKSGSFGVPFQLQYLKEHDLKATYFVETLFGSVAGLPALKEIIGLIQNEGQEVQLHAHTEWLGEIKDPQLPNGFRQHIRQFPLGDQVSILRRAAANFRDAGGRGLCAFRAGNFGANFDTLKALATLGITFDSSHNYCRIGSMCALDTGDLLTQPAVLEGVYEFPLSFFQDYPGHYRQAQLCACSFGEMRQALLSAWQAGWYGFVLLFHGSELLGECKGFGKPSAPNSIIVQRFKRLCGFLADNRDKFRTTFFSEIAPELIPMPAKKRMLPIRSGVHRTAWRFAEQFAGRFV